MTYVVVLSINALMTCAVYALSKSNACQARECELRISGLTLRITGFANVNYG